VIDKLKRARTLVGVSAALLLASGVAYAATDTGSRPAVSQEDTTSTSVDPSSTTSTSVGDSTTSTTEETTTTTVAPGGGATTTTEPEAEHHGAQDNHGACVSQAAHDTPPGPDHGKTVSSVAQSDCGKGAPEANANENEPAEHETEPAEPTEQQHGSQSGDHGGSSGSDHGGGHGGPGRD
jgi:hypothetical protein